MSSQPLSLPVWLQPLAEQLANPAATAEVVRSRPGKGGRAAAVLLALAGEELATAHVLLVERAHTLRHHPGQLAFPGGAVEAGDRDLAATALREGQEETGLDPESVQILGALPAAHVAVSGFDVHAIVGWWHRPHPVAVADPAEVAQVLTVDLGDLINPAHRVSVQHHSGYRGPGFWITDAVGESLLVWGLTAHLLQGVLQLAGWEEPWDHDQVIEVPRRFLQDQRQVGTDNSHDAH